MSGLTYGDQAIAREHIGELRDDLAAEAELAAMLERIAGELAVSLRTVRKRVAAIRRRIGRAEDKLQHKRRWADAQVAWAPGSARAVRRAKRVRRSPVDLDPAVVADVELAARARAGDCQTGAGGPTHFVPGRGLAMSAALHARIQAREASDRNAPGESLPAIPNVHNAKGREVSRGPSVSCSGSTLTGDFSAQTSGAYLRRQSYSGTAPNRGWTSSDTRTDATDKPSPQDSATVGTDSALCKRDRDG